MATYLTVVPSYGRDYTKKADVLADWLAGKDFTIADAFSPDDGRQINKQDAERTPGLVVQVRYAKRMKIAAIKLGKTGWKAS